MAVLWYLLRQKDALRGEQIKDLYAKHVADADKLQELELNVAKRHYEKTEMDAKFDKLEQAFTQGSDKICSRFDQLTAALLQGRH